MVNPPRIKVCGIRRLEDAKLAVELGVDYLGLIFAPSRRQVSEARARALARATAGAIERVGVFVNASRDAVLRAVDAAELSAVQLHGDESPEFCAALGVRAIKVVRVGMDAPESMWQRYTTWGFLADTAGQRGAGGTGRPFDWQPARGWARQVRLFLAGGLSPDNVGRAVATVEPFAVDVSSGIERQPAIKDHQLMRDFVRAARTRELG